jgi:hypothetical protein
MFKLEEFGNNLILEKVDKLNKYLSKNKVDKISRILDEFQNLLDKQEYVVTITYIISVLAENRVELISERLIQKIKSFLNSDNLKLRINSIIIIGFAMIANPTYLARYFQEFMRSLLDKSEDLRNNIHYFLIELIKRKPSLIDSNIYYILESFKIEKNDENIYSLLKCLDFCGALDFDHLYNLRNVIKSLINSSEILENSKIYDRLIKVGKKFFPKLNEFDLDNLETNEILNLLENQFLMKKHNFSVIRKNKDIKLKDYLETFSKSNLKNEKVYFYTKTKENIIFIYELEKRKLKEFFEREIKITDKEIQNAFSQIIDKDSELKTFIKTLNNLKIINGYYSNIGFFYPYIYLKSKFLEDLDVNGVINIKNFNFLPKNTIDKIIKGISKSTNQNFLKYKDQETYISLEFIKDQINSEAAKESVIDLKSYRDILLEEDFIKLIKNMSKKYLSKFHKGTQWLTNLGTQKITNEVQNSKIMGFFNITKISDKLKIGEVLLLDVFDHFVDYRSGIWNKEQNIFYYSKYLKDKIDEIRIITDERERLIRIEKISKELNIDKNHILSKIDENLQLIAEEIKQKEQIKISEYLEKTGMEINSFLKFIDDLGISYFKKADYLLFKPEKIEDAKNDIKYMLIDKSRSDDYISLGNYDITSSLIKELINDLLVDGKVKGIFHESEGQVLFYTERGIRNLMLENSFIFSFHDLFYGKNLNSNEIDFLKEIFNELLKNRKIKGTFDEESLTFSSSEVIFAKDYNTVVSEFEKMVNNYNSKFETEFQKIRRILTKDKETIFPQEIKIIQETIDNLNEKYVSWRSGLEVFIRNMNKKLLRDQGISLKQYKNLFLKEKKEEIKSLEEDPEVYELLNSFNRWVKLFNKLELKYPNVIFYQKRLINNPDDLNSKSKLKELLEELNLN